MQNTGDGVDFVGDRLNRRVVRIALTFIPLDHDPGQRVECDFGHIHVDFPKAGDCAVEHQPFQFEAADGTA